MTSTTTSETAGPTAPVLVRSRLDYVLIPAFVLGMVNSLLLSLPEGLGVSVSPDSPWPPWPRSTPGRSSRSRSTW